MKKLVLALFLLVLIQNAYAPGVGIGTGVGVDVDESAPLVWMDPNHRVLLDDPTSPGAITGPGEVLLERINNYAFEGEQVLWKVVGYHKNGKNEIDEVNVVIYNDTVNRTEVSCVEITGQCLGNPSVNSCNNFDFETCEIASGCSTGCDYVIASPADIQDVIDLAPINSVICVDSGNYLGPLTINKPLTIRGVHDVTGIDAAVLSLVSGNSVIEISSDNVTIEGLQIDGNGYVGPFQFAGIIVNTDVSNSNLKNIIIKNNWIKDLSVSAGFSAKGIHLQTEQSDPYKISNVLIENNLIENIKGSNKGSYGIQANNDLENITIQQNLIRNITSGAWGGGINVGCHPNKPVIQDVYIYRNSLSNSTNPLVASMYVDNCGRGNEVILEENNLYGTVANLNLTTAMNAENNYWGTLNATKISTRVSANVDFNPFANSAFAVDGVSEPFMCLYTPGTCEQFSDNLSCSLAGCDWFGPQSYVDIWDGVNHLTEFDPVTMNWYQCIFTVEPGNLMHGEYYAKAEAIANGFRSESAEHELWFFNPEIALGLDGTIDFGTISPGQTAKSSPVIITNAAEAGSGVLLDMYIAGEDFYSSANGPTNCPNTNKLALANFRYYGSHGSYNTCLNSGVDFECYDSIPYFMDGAGSPLNNNYQRMIDNTPTMLGEYPLGNILSPGDDITLLFKLSLPVPCSGGPFDEGEIRFFGEAI